MENFFNSPFFHITLCIVCYGTASYFQRRSGKSWMNPLLISIAMIIAILVLLQIPYGSFKSGSSIIAMMLTPATCVLAVPMFNQLSILKKNWLPIVAGTFLGALTSIISVSVLCRLLNLNETVTASLLPKSVTTPIALSVCEVQGGIAAITVTAVLVTGLLGSLIIPAVFDKLKIKNSVALGITLGTASHALGTSKAIEIGEQEGGLSGLAIGITGIFTVILTLILF